MKNRLHPFQGWRLTFFQGIIFAVFALFSLRMYELQIVQYDRYEARSNENRLSALPLAASRGPFGIAMMCASPSTSLPTT